MTFIAAIQVIATTDASLRLTVLALAVVVIINVMLVWLFLAGSMLVASVVLLVAAFTD